MGESGIDKFKKDIFELIELAKEAIDHVSYDETYDQFMEDLDLIATRLRNYMRKL